MHRYEAKNGTIFCHNPDLSGEVLLRAKDGNHLVSISADDLVEFIDHCREQDDA